MKGKVKTILVVFLLSFTCFLTQCQGCLKSDKVTHKLLPDQVNYTVSCGFPAAYFDVEILNSSDESYYYRTKGSDVPAISIAVNVIIMIMLYAFLMFLQSKNYIILNRFLNITLVLIVLFSSSLLMPYYPKVVQQIAVYLYFYPVSVIKNLVVFVKLEAFEQNLSPRVYLVFLMIFLYSLMFMAGKIRKKFFFK